jgi:hypothetical protein
LTLAGNRISIARENDPGTIPLLASMSKACAGKDLAHSE